MQNKNIHDLTLRLAQALDQNYDVVHMDDVISVISILEGTTITKEQLETTRLAKYINHLRRRTRSEPLARRAKSLLKKWREMVGIQHHQQNNDSTNSSSMISNNVNINQEQRLQEQSISQGPISINFDAMHQLQSNSNSSQNIAASISGLPTIDMISRPATIQNILPIALGASSSKYVRINPQSSNRRLEHSEGISEVESAMSNSSTGVGTINKKQPINFQNLLSEICDNEVNVGDANNISHYEFSKSTHRNAAPNQTLMTDHSSNSNSHISFNLPNKSSNMEPIIIDIQDSNSGSNLITPDIKVIENIATTPFTKNSLNTASYPPITIPAKTKKVKKEKKRKEKEISLQNIDTICALNCKETIDETSNQQCNQMQLNQNDEKSAAILSNDKSRLTFPISNISEILSLSNSSMASVFPSEGVTIPFGDQNITNLSTYPSDSASFNLATFDLSFAGKFKQSNSLVPTSSNNVISSSHRTTTPNMALSNNFMPFKESNSNSNESNSNSRNSHFDRVDVDREMALNNIRVQQKQDVFHSQQKPLVDENKLTPQPPVTPSLIVLPQKDLQSGENESTQTTNVVPEKKIPRKRGRKKGSKGIDSVIAKETSLSSQTLLSTLCSGVKKVKTTKELFTEITNRKMGVANRSSSPTSTNWHLQQATSRPTSSCSEPSLQSPRTLDACSTNATTSTLATRSTPDKCLNNNPDDSESETATSEPSRDSAATQKNNKRSISIDSNSNSQLISMKMNEFKTFISAPPSTSKTSAEKHIYDILKKLPPAPNIRSIEMKLTAELVPCACKIIEIFPSTSDVKKANNESTLQNQDGKIAAATSEKAVKTKRKVEPFEKNSGQEHCAASSETIFTNVDVGSDSKPPKLENVESKPVKSIFDFDFDDDNDPLNTIKAEAAAANVRKDTDDSKINVAKGSTENTNIILNNADTTENVVKPEIQILEEIQQHLPKPEVIPDAVLPSYEVVEDPNCLAKQRYEIQTQKITNFHINSLHNYFIPNVNGNWDNSNSVKKTPEDQEFTPIDGYDVVPKYGSLIIQNIKKDLSHITFCRTFAHKSNNVSFNKLPFLGIARTFPPLRKQNKKRIHKNCHKAVNKHDEKCKTGDTNSQPETSSFVANSTEYKNITIDVSEPSEIFVPQVSVVTDKMNKPNLLAIVESVKYDSNKLIDNAVQVNNNSPKVKTQNEYAKEQCNTSIPCEETTNEMSILESMDGNISSRRSSTCSNNSLKQTQQSINLKLKRQFQGKKILRAKRKLKKDRDVEVNNDSDKEGYRKPRIKRIKIAINGEYATKMQLSDGSSNNSSDDENRGERLMADEIVNEDYSEVDGDRDERYESNNSTHTTDDNETEDQEADFDNSVDADADFDDEYEDGDEYVSAYHEVVTRDIATHSTGNNHIVLTIKKTPSKTNSPSNSLSGMSPVIINNNSIINSQNLTTPITPTTTQLAANTADFDNVKDKDLNIRVIDINDNKNDINNSKIAEQARKDSETKQQSNMDSIQLVVEPNGVPCAMPPSDVAHAADSRVKRRFRCRRRKLKKKNIVETNNSMAIRPKKHQQLFFPHELCLTDNNGLSQKIFNITSCSSSCTEDSDIENGSTLISEQNEKQDFEPSDLIHNKNSVHCKNMIDVAVDHCDNSRTFRCRSRSSSISSVCSTCSSDASPTSYSNVNDVAHCDAIFSSKHSDELPQIKSNESNCEIEPPSSDMEVDDKLKKKYSTSADVNNDELPVENNGLLNSFNNIYCTTDQINTVTDADFDIAADGNVTQLDSNEIGIDAVEIKPEKQQPRNENCDYYNNIYNMSTNNINLINYFSNVSRIENHTSCKQSGNSSNSEQHLERDYIQNNMNNSNNSDLNVDGLRKVEGVTDSNLLMSQPHKLILEPHNEYRTGLRKVDEDVDDEDGNNCARIQQFKEWHQVLQLRSYNDELLTVLPYVVLE